MNRSVLSVLLLALLVGCTQAPATPVTPSSVPPTSPGSLTPSLTSTPASQSTVPNFEHIAIIMFENKEFGSAIGSPLMPAYNKLAQSFTLLTQYYAIRHPSLPNYIALMGGDTFGIASDCKSCFVNAPSLPDLIEKSGRTWKAYMEDMPSPCFLGDQGNYVQKHNPFVYFDPIRTDQARCQRSVVPLSALATDIATASLPNFLFIKPNICNDSHSCELDKTDAWLTGQLAILTPALELTGKPYLIVVMFEEGQGDHTCCGLSEPGGGRVPVVLVSPQVKNGFEDPTPYTHYSLLKTISAAWGLQYLGHAADDSNVIITAPWK